MDEEKAGFIQKLFEWCASLDLAYQEYTTLLWEYQKHITTKATKPTVDI